MAYTKIKIMIKADTVGAFHLVEITLLWQEVK